MGGSPFYILIGGLLLYALAVFIGNWRNESDEIRSMKQNYPRAAQHEFSRNTPSWAHSFFGRFDSWWLVAACSISGSWGLAMFFTRKGLLVKISLFLVFIAIRWLISFLWGRIPVLNEVNKYALKWTNAEPRQPEAKSKIRAPLLNQTDLSEKPVQSDLDAAFIQIADKKMLGLDSSMGSLTLTALVADAIQLGRYKAAIYLIERYSDWENDPTQKAYREMALMMLGTGKSRI